jgi:flagellar M-ring protein FliF
MWSAEAWDMSSADTQLEKSGAPGLLSTSGIVEQWWSIKKSWASMSRRQRAWTLAAAGILASITAGVSWYGLRTDWRVVYAGLDPEDARQISLSLTQAQIPFEFADNGMSLRVPAAQLDKARMATAGKGIRSGRMGFELFDKPNWVGSEFDEQVNFQRALEGELEHTVSSLSDVQTARVHLVLPHDSLFQNERRPAKASVVLKLRRSSLADGEADSIRNLVASAVDGLSPDQVVLIDAAGRLLLMPKTPDALRLSAEQSLEEKIISTLEAVTGPGNVRASVNLEYDPDAVEETSETYDPSQSATLAMERTEQTTNAQPVAAGVPGTASNAPNSQPLPVYPRLSTAPQTSRTESGSYGVSKSVRHKVANAGRVRRITAAVVVNDRHNRSAATGGSPQSQARTAEEIRNFTSLAQAAIGYDASRGDVVSVQGITFEEKQSETHVSSLSRIVSTIQTSPELLKYPTVLLGILLLITLGVRPALRQATRNPGQEIDGPLPVLGAGNQPVLTTKPVNDADRLRVQELFEKVTSQMKEQPSQSSRLLQSWIHSE